MLMIYLPPGNCRNKHVCFQNAAYDLTKFGKKGQVDHKNRNVRVDVYDLPGLF